MVYSYLRHISTNKNTEKKLIFSVFLLRSCRTKQPKKTKELMSLGYCLSNYSLIGGGDGNIVLVGRTGGLSLPGPAETTTTIEASKITKVKTVASNLFFIGLYHPFINSKHCFTRL